MNALDLGELLALATLIWLLGLALGGASYWLLVTRLDRAPRRTMPAA